MVPCLICYGETTTNPLNDKDKLESQLSPIFLVLKLLGLSEEICCELLSSHGNPATWEIPTCPDCSEVLSQAQLIHSQIQQLQKKFTTLRGQCESKIKIVNNVLEKTSIRTKGGQMIIKKPADLIRNEVAQRLETLTGKNEIADKPGLTTELLHDQEDKTLKEELLSEIQSLDSDVFSPKLVKVYSVGVIQEEASSTLIETEEIMDIPPFPQDGGVGSILSTPQKEESTISFPIWFNFKDQTEHFVGREKELKLLQEIISQKQIKLILLSGLGGIGKSELVRFYAKQMHENGNVNCIWLSGENPATLTQSINKLANHLGLETEEKHTAEVLIELIKVANKKKGRWLFVMDNVDELHELVKLTFKLLSKIQTCLIILTSRLRKQIVKQAVLIELQELETPDAKLFVQKSLKVGYSEEISQLCEALHNLPLALQQAVAFIREQQIESLEGFSYGIQEYLQEFENQTKDLLGYQIESLSEENERTTLTTWNVTINKIRSLEGNSNGSIFLLRCLAYLHPDGISIKFLKVLLKKVEGLVDKIPKCLLLLKSYSLLRMEDEEIEIHRLVQKLIQIDCTQNGHDKMIIRTLAEGSLRSVGKGYLKYEKLRQLLTIWDHVKKDDELTITFKNTPIPLADRLDDLGFYSQMLQFSKETIERFNKLLPDTDPDVLRMQSQLGLANYWIDENEEALRILEETYSKMKVNLGEEAEATLATADNLKIILLELKRFDEAAALYQSVLDSKSGLH